MSDVPQLVQNAPKFLYVCVALFFVASVSLEMFEASLQYRGTGMDPNEAIVLRARVVFNAAREAFYMLTTVFWLQVLLAIWRRMVGKSQGGQGVNQ
jgi:hypothetical protein